MAPSVTQETTMKRLNGILAGLSTPPRNNRFGNTAVVMERFGTEESLEQAVREANLAAMQHPDGRAGEIINERLSAILAEARRERLECAIPLIQTLQFSIAKEHSSRAMPPGVLTVNGWMNLLNHWDNQLDAVKKRQIFYAKPFFTESLEKLIAVQSPLAILFQELLEMMEKRLEVEMEASI